MSDDYEDDLEDLDYGDEGEAWCERCGETLGECECDEPIVVFGP